MGSVKTLHVKIEPTAKEMGTGSFEFTDDYSVFDYGKMPDTIPEKGAALVAMATYNFVELRRNGIRSHYIATPDARTMEVSLVRVIQPGKEGIPEGTINYLVPLEIIFRNSLPEGSSVFKRLKSGQLHYEDLGLNHMPVPGEKLFPPLLDVSTKLEETDRYLTWEEAAKLSGLGPRIAEVNDIALMVNDFINRRANEVGLYHADGKIELAVDDRGELMLVDVCGTLDEDRLEMNGVQVSKQVMRDHYKTTDWYARLEAAKKAGLPKKMWPEPPHVPQVLRQIGGNMYTSTANEWAGQLRWPAPPLADVVAEYKAWLAEQKKDL